MVLGLGQLKQWVYLLSFKQSDGDFSAEIIKTSFLRGSLCSELSQYATRLNLAKSDAYLLGMFSTLDVLLQIPLKEALRELPIIDEIRDALTEKTGSAGTLYRLILAYETADWGTVSSCAEELGLDSNIVAQKYLECVEAVNYTWNSLQRPFSEE
ncbi:Cyclic di-GMP phosphodiesterase CdgJ [bioreactor metagenome]|uniref:Cyclic di-GMP phosphodiesterase CdgJ n=1 Tax=bioreactor metagenome TaxID=1076179 RepID=A0A645IQP8_9ZZZZ